MTMKRIHLFILTLFAAVLSTTAVAEPAWLCSINDAVAVDENGAVAPPDLDGKERPTFLRVDAETKTVTLLAPESRRGEVTKIDAAQEHEGQWLFSGMEEDRAWSLVITDEGRMTLSMVCDGAVWSIFGHTLAEEGADH